MNHLVTACNDDSKGDGIGRVKNKKKGEMVRIYIIRCVQRVHEDVEAEPFLQQFEDVEAEPFL